MSRRTPPIPGAAKVVSIRRAIGPNRSRVLAIMGGLMALAALVLLSRLLTCAATFRSWIRAERRMPFDQAPRASLTSSARASRSEPTATVARSARPMRQSLSASSLRQGAVALPPTPRAVELASTAGPVLPQPSASAVPPANSASAELGPSKPHRVPFAALSAWAKPGLCSTAADASAAREKVMTSFRLEEPAAGGKIYVDPRLPNGAETAVLAYLEQAERETRDRLGLLPARPLVFVYADEELMKAAACINESAVAFYDGALHVVANRSDVLASVLHEYTHHALFSSGFVAPAWAQEGIAMSIAREKWWSTPEYLTALLATPFSMEQMDRSIAYKLPSTQAVAFYVQSAALVNCLLEGRNWGLRELVAALRAGTSRDALTYDLPELERSTFFSACFAKGPR